MRKPFGPAIILVIAICFVTAPGVVAQEPPAAATPAPEQAEAAKVTSVLDEKKLSDIGVDFKAFYRMAEFCDDLAACAGVIRKVAEQNLEMLREPRDDGSYRWASFQRVEAGRTSLEKEILKVHTEATLDTIELTGKRSYRVVVTAPKKRSLVSSNNKVFVKNVVADVTGMDGKTRTVEVPVGVWVNPGDSHSVPLDDIAISARVKVNVGVESGTKKAVASVALLEAGLVDDPLNPFHPAVRRLNTIVTIVKEKTVSRGQLKAVAEEAVLDLPGEMAKMMELREASLKRLRQLTETGQAAGTIAVGDATPDVIHELSKAAKLLTGTVAEQEEGRKSLDALIQRLSPPPPPQPEPAPPVK